MRILCLAIAWLLTIAAAPAPLTVTLDTESATAVLAAVRNTALTREQALAIARLPGSKGLIRKARSYEIPADEGTLADSLLAAAQRRKVPTNSYFQFDDVRDNAEAIGKVLAELTDPASRALPDVKARIAQFSPPDAKGAVTGYIVVGGSSGGFAFGEPAFFLNLARFPSAPLAAVITGHELYHAVQGVVRSARPPLPARTACLAQIGAAKRLGNIFDPLMQEGTASYVGDVLALPANSADPAIRNERRRVARGVEMIGRGVTLLGLSVHAAANGSVLSDDDIYAIGFYDDELLYPLGYVMARAISEERGPQAIAGLIGGSGAQFVATYLGLKRYGTDPAPKLDSTTEGWAKQLAACG